MKRRITLSIALVVSVILVSLMSSDSTVKAQQVGLRRVADTGVYTPGSNQIVRLTVNSLGGNDTINVRFRRIEYGEGTCNSEGVCTHAVVSQTTSTPTTVMPGEGVSIDFRRCMSPICGGVRGLVLSSNRNVRVNVLVIDSLTGEVTNARELALDDIGPFGG